MTNPYAHKSYKRYFIPHAIVLPHVPWSPLGPSNRPLSHPSRPLLPQSIRLFIQSCSRLFIPPSLTTWNKAGGIPNRNWQLVVISHRTAFIHDLRKARRTGLWVTDRKAAYRPYGRLAHVRGQLRMTVLCGGHVGGRIEDNSLEEKRITLRWKERRTFYYCEMTFFILGRRRTYFRESKRLNEQLQSKKKVDKKFQYKDCAVKKKLLAKKK